MKINFAIIISFLLLGCTAENSANNINNSVQVVDFDGNNVILNKPAERLIALAPHIVENIYSAGAGDSLVGVMAFSNFPQAALDLPIVASYDKTNYEKIIALKPDLIIAWASGNSHNSVNRLRELGYPVYIDQADTLADVAKSIRDIGVLTGNTEQANNTAADYLQGLTKLQNKYQNSPILEVFYQVWQQPLYTINGKHIISDAIRLCGGVNIYADELAVSPVINIESLLQRNPDVIVAGANPTADWLHNWQKWHSLKAVQNQHLFIVNPDHMQRHTVRLLLGVESLCEQMQMARSTMPQLDLTK